MTLRTKPISFNLLVSACIAVLSAQPSPSAEATRTIVSQDHGGAPHLTVRVYSLTALSPFTLAAAEAEADRMLRSTHVRLTWVNCPSQAIPSLCAAPKEITDLIVRVLPTAFPRATANALGMTMWSEYGSSAVLFYDRIVACRTHQAFSWQILGRAIAHELVHLLLPGASHADIGLMTAKWSTEDLKFGNLACLSLSRQSVRLIQREAWRRMYSAKAIPDR